MPDAEKDAPQWCPTCHGHGWTGSRHGDHYHCSCGAPCGVDRSEGCTGARPYCLRAGASVSDEAVRVAEDVWTEDEPTLAEYELTERILRVARDLPPAERGQADA